MLPLPCHIRLAGCQPGTRYSNTEGPNPYVDRNSSLYQCLTCYNNKPVILCVETIAEVGSLTHKLKRCISYIHKRSSSYCIIWKVGFCYKKSIAFALEFAILALWKHTHETATTSMQEFVYPGYLEKDVKRPCQTAISRPHYEAQIRHRS